MVVGKSIVRVDAIEKVTGRAKYTDDFFYGKMLIAKILHSTIANGVVKSIDTSEAEKIDGIIKIVTCFDVPKIDFPTPGHPWSTDPKHRDVSDRRLLNERVRLYGDDIAAVIAEDEVIASRALKAIKVEYEEYKPLMTPQIAMEEDAGAIHDSRPDNILAHSSFKVDNTFDDAIKDEEDLIFSGGSYQTQMVQH